jgi:dsRNA-specific ribonuclease
MNDIKNKTDNINYIGKLQEHSQKNNIPLPKYEECGIESNGQFKCMCIYQDYTMYGVGKTKKEAKRHSAYLMYTQL